MKSAARATLTTITALSAFVLLNSCTIKKDGEAVDYGPEVSSNELNKALLTPLSSLDPLSIKVGQFVHFSTVEDFAGGQVSEVVSDIGQTIVSQEDTPSTLRYDIVQETVNYLTGKSNSTSVQYQLNFAKTTTPGPAAPAPAGSLLLAQMQTQLAATLTNGIDVSGLASSGATNPLPTPGTSSSPSPTPTPPDPTPTPSPTASATPAPVKVTFHRLIVSDSLDAAPNLVAARPNCLGLTNCLMHVHHVSFDQVTWSDSQGEKVHFELSMSADAPLLSGYRMTPLFEYYPGLIKSCISLLVDVGTTGTKTLLTECNQIEDFLYQAAPATTN